MSVEGVLLDVWEDESDPSASSDLGFCVNPFTLPFVSLRDKRFLPSKPGLYFVIDGANLLYVGRSKDLNVRWKSHHRYKQVAAMTKNPMITFLDVEDEKLLWVERTLINRLKPLLNDTRVDDFSVKAPAPQPSAQRTQEPRSKPDKKPNWVRRPTQVVMSLEQSFDWQHQQMAFETALEKVDLEGRIAEIRSLFAQMKKLTVAQNKEYLELTKQLDQALGAFHGFGSTNYVMNLHKFPTEITKAYEDSRNRFLAAQLP